MNLGAEPKKVAMLGGLLLVGGYFFYTNVISDDGPPRTPQTGAAESKNQDLKNALDGSAPAAPATRGPVVRSTSKSAKTSEEFHPSLKRKPEDAIAPESIDPTLRLDLLAKVQSQQLETAGRNPFQFGQPPPPPVPKIAPLDAKALAAAKAKEAQAKPPEPPAPTGPPKPPPLNLPWKYYGYSTPRGSTQKRAFFLDGEDILTANEGDVVKKKYKVVRIGVNSVVMEDIDTKSQQTLPLAEEAMG
jgi:hypothetical protein